MKSRIEVENNWIKITEQISRNSAKDKTEYLKIKDECAKEFMWYFSHSITEKELKIRIEKFKRFEEAGSAHVFDPFWRQRLEFLKWILE